MQNPHATQQTDYIENKRSDRKMLDVLIGMLINTSASTPIHSCRTPAIDPNHLTDVVIYDTRLISEHFASVTMSGGCYLGRDTVNCTAFQLGDGFA